MSNRVIFIPARDGLETHPTLAELRLRCHKQYHQTIGNWLARRVARPTAIYGTWIAIRLGLSANQVTVAAMVTAIGGALAMGSGSRSGFLFAVILWHVAYWLDHVDGQVARWRATSSLDGVYLDYLLHHIWNLTQGFALGFGLAILTGEPTWSLAGFGVALGWCLLSLHNDCRYKAIFQRLKSDRRSFRVDGGSGGRPSPAAPWPRHGLGIITWPAAKSCESHVVLLSLTGMAVVAVLLPDAWIALWKTYVVVMACGSLLLALGRIGKSIRNGRVEAEFTQWFRATN